MPKNVEKNPQNNSEAIASQQNSGNSEQNCFVYTVTIVSKGVLSSEITQITDNIIEKVLQQVICMVASHFSSVILKRAFPQTQLLKSLIPTTKKSVIVTW